MGGSTMPRIAGSGEAVLGAALSVFGFPEIGIPMMAGGITGAVKGDYKPSMIGAGVGAGLGLGGAGLGALGAGGAGAGGAAAAAPVGGGMGGVAGSLPASMAGGAIPASAIAYPGEAAATGGGMGIFDTLGAGQGGGITGTMKNAALLKSLMPQGGGQQPMPPPIQSQPRQAAPMGMSPPSPVVATPQLAGPLPQTGVPSLDRQRLAQILYGGGA